jgi:hypothetical protein
LCLRIAVAKERFFFGTGMSLTLIFRPKLLTRNTHRIKQLVLFHVFPGDADTAVTQIELQLLETPVLAQSNVPNGGDVHGLATFTTLIAFPSSYQHKVGPQPEFWLSTNNSFIFVSLETVLFSALHLGLGKFGGGATKNCFLRFSGAANFQYQPILPTL